MSEKKGEKGTILIIDDELDVLSVLSKRLEDSGYRVETSDDALEGFLKVKDILPSLIILDIAMPKTDGLQIKKRLSEDRSVVDIPVIFLTAKSSIADKIAGLRLGADDFVTKPFEFEELLARIESAINRRKYYEEIAATDPMTGLANFHSFKKEFGLFFRTAQRYHRTFSLVLIDVDDLKMINDKYGHRAGDLALRAVASTMPKVFRTTDRLIRYGGDEFAVIMPETNQNQADRAIQRLGQEIEKVSLETQDGSQVSISVSAGCGVYGSETTSEEALFNQVDKALYQDKMAKKERKK